MALRWLLSLLCAVTLVATTVAQSPFEQGSWNLQVTAGYADKFALGPIAPDFQMIPLNLRLGHMLSSPTECAGPLNGNLEVLFELALAPPVHTFANIITGPSLLLRYNNTALFECVVPYIQAGAGVVYNDGYQDVIQRALGQAGEFYLQGGVGLRFLVAANWTVESGLDFYHISNAGVADRNAGLNCFGASLGVTYHFGPR